MDRPISEPECPHSMRITENVPMAHVVDVDRSVEFYSLIGFACDNRFRSPDGTTNWASVSSGRAKMFLSRACNPIVPSEQAVLFYMYSDDIRGLRHHLLSRGLRDAGAIPVEGESFAAEQHGNSLVFEIISRFYMPLGELRIHDPDGYCILVGQIG